MYNVAKIMSTVKQFVLALKTRNVQEMITDF